MFVPPTGVYDSFVTQPAALKWYQVLFNPSKPLQSRELNEMQTIIGYQFAQLGGTLYKEGTFLNGGLISSAPSATPNKISVAFTDALIWASGTVIAVPADSVDIDPTGTQTISLVIEPDKLTATDLPLLEDPVVLSADYGVASADRLVLNLNYAVNAVGGIAVATYIDGQLDPKSVTRNSTIYYQILSVLAQRTFETSGNYLAPAPNVKIKDITDAGPNPTQMRVTILGGIGYNRGNRWENKETKLALTRPLTGEDRLNEPSVFATGTTIYDLDNPPCLGVNTLEATLRSPTISMTRGGVVNGSDGIPSQYQPVANVVSVVQGGTTYVASTDYVLAGNNITWLSGGTQPATGSSYNLIVNYTANLTLGKRTYTLTTGETHVVSSSTTTLTNHAYGVADVVSIKKGATTYVEGVDFTVNYATGVVTWASYTVAPGSGQTVTCVYHYWANTIDGDFLARNSWVDAAGNILYNIAPTKSPLGSTINYKSQIAFETTAGKTPVNTTQFLVNYTYALGRIDVLTWSKDGVFQLFTGTPSVSPVPVTVDDDFTPVVKIILPAEANAADVITQGYSNETLKVTQQRQMLRRIQDLEYDVARFILEQNAINTTTPTDKRGIFADNLATLDLADITNGSFAGTFDPLGRAFLLPRTAGTQTPTPTSTTATLHTDTWMTNYDETLAISQPYSSDSRVINPHIVLPTETISSIDVKSASVVMSPTTDTTTSTTVETRSTNNPVTPTPVPQQWIMHRHTWLALSPNTPVNTFGRLVVTGPQPWQGKVPPNGDWTSYLNNTARQDYTSSGSSSSSVFGVSTSAQHEDDDSWEQIKSNCQTVVTSFLKTITVTVTGSNFKPNERMISCVFNGVQCALTPTGSTSADSDTTHYPGTVVANSSGAWTATFQVPGGQPAGTYEVTFQGHLASDTQTIGSIVVCNFNGTPYLPDISKTVTKPSTPPVYDGALHTCPWFGFTDALGTGHPHSAVLNAASGPMSQGIALGIAHAIQLGNTLTHTNIATAITALVKHSRVKEKMTSTVITAIANAADPASTDVIANAAAMEAVAPIVAQSLQGFAVNYFDTLAQTFTPANDCMLTSVNLQMRTVSASGVPISVSIAPVVNGAPTTQYLGTAVQPDGHTLSTTTKTNFSFNTPIMLKGGTQYALMVNTNDTNAAVAVAVLGHTDPTNGFISQSPASGTMLISTDGNSWLPVLGSSVMFDVNVCLFETTQAILNFGQLTFPQSSNAFSWNLQFAEPSHDCSIQMQYSSDGASWTDFAPLKEVDLGLSTFNMYFRILMNGTAYLCPTVVDKPELGSYIFQASGAYVHREFDVGSAILNQSDVYVDVDLPGNTALAVSTDWDDTTGYHAMTRVTADDRPIDGTWVQRHYTITTTSKQKVRTKFALSSTLTYRSPRIRNIIVIATD